MSKKERHMERPRFPWIRTDTEPKSGTQERLEVLRPHQLTGILQWAYGEKDWERTSDEYWKDQWTYLHPKESQKADWSAERRRIYNFLKSILYWSYDLDEDARPLLVRDAGGNLAMADTKGHLDPLPGIPKEIINEEEKNQEGEPIVVLGPGGPEIQYFSPEKSQELKPREITVKYREPKWNDPDEVNEAIANLAKYYFNEGQPGKIKPIMVVNALNTQELLAILTLRWKGDKLAPPNKKIASIERFVVNPKMRSKGIGSRILGTAIDYAFFKYKGYKDEEGAREVRAWIMTDKGAGEFSRNEVLFKNYGFKKVQGERGDWENYAKILGIDTHRKADWYKLSKEDWEGIRRTLRVRPYDIII